MYCLWLHKYIVVGMDRFGKILSCILPLRMECAYLQKDTLWIWIIWLSSHG